MTPAVSVLLPVRDAAATLDACLASLAAQTLVDHEVVAVDDGSTDDTPLRLRAWTRCDPRLRVLRQPPRGLVAALEAARAAARAPLLARMDADDVAAPARLERQHALLEAEPQVDLVAARVRLVGSPGRENAGMARYVGWSNALVAPSALRHALWIESPFVHPSVTLRAERLRALGGYRAFPGPEDYELWLRALLGGWTFAKCPEVLLDWTDGPARLTRTDARYAAARFRAVKAAALAAGPLRSRPAVIWGAGPIGKRLGRALCQAGAGVAAFVEVHPRRLGGRIQGAPVVDVAGAAAFADAVHLAAVGQEGARERILEAACAQGRRLGDDLLAVA